MESPNRTTQRRPPAQRGRGCRSATTSTNNFGVHGVPLGAPGRPLWLKLRLERPKPSDGYSGAGGVHRALTNSSLLRVVTQSSTTQAQRPGARDAWIATATLSPGSLQRMLGGQTAPIPFVLRVRVKHQASGVVGYQHKPAPRNSCPIDVAQFEEFTSRTGRIQFVPYERWWFCILCRIRATLHVRYPFALLR
jgi:hypothetical protein